MAKLSDLAYLKDAPALRKEISELGLQLIDFQSIDDTEFFIAKSEKFYVLTFRGTASVKDALTDLYFFPKKNKGRVFHGGFRKSYLKVKLTIEEHLKSMELPLFVTGHSLGGAQALIACVESIDPKMLSACYTFGCPSVGDTALDQSTLKFPIYRVVNGFDIVPRVPPWFQGSGHIVFLWGNSTRFIGTQASAIMIFIYAILFVSFFIWIPICALVMFSGKEIFPPITNHLLKSYIPKLERIANARSDHRKLKKEIKFLKWAYSLSYILLMVFFVNFLLKQINFFGF